MLLYGAVARGVKAAVGCQRRLLARATVTHRFGVRIRSLYNTAIIGDVVRQAPDGATLTAETCNKRVERV